MGVGLCANSHLEGTLAKLEEYGKSDAFKKSPSIFNLLKVRKISWVLSRTWCSCWCQRDFFLLLFTQERNDVEVEKVKSTLILCYGHVALNAPPEKILNHIDQDILCSITKHFNTKVKSLFLSKREAFSAFPSLDTHLFFTRLARNVEFLLISYFEAVAGGHKSIICLSIHGFITSILYRFWGLK